MPGAVLPETHLPHPKPDSCPGLLCVPGPRLCPKSPITIKHKSSLNSTQHPQCTSVTPLSGQPASRPTTGSGLCPLPPPPTEALLVWRPPHLQPHVPHSLDAPLDITHCPHPHRSACVWLSVFPLPEHSLSESAPPARCSSVWNFRGRGPHTECG